MQKNLNIYAIRNFGIKKNRGYQPVFIYKYLFSYINKFYLVKPNKIYYVLYPKLNFMISLKFIKDLIIKLSRNKQLTLSYDDTRKLYEKYISTIIKNNHNKIHLFAYFPSKNILDILEKNSNNQKILYTGSLPPQYNSQIFKDEINILRDICMYNKSLWDDSLQFDEKLTKFDYIIVNSNYSKKIWSHYFPANKIYICPLGVDFEYFNKTITEKQRINDKIFLFMGRIEIMKGVHYLLNAWEQLDLKDAKLWLVGSKNSREWSYFENRIKNMQNVEYLGYRTDLPELYNKSLVFVFPSLSEGFGKVVLEAMASGLPIIGTPCVSEQFECGKEGFEINYSDVDGLKKYIQYFYDNPEKAIEMGYNAKLKAKTKTWDKFGENFRNVILNIIKGEVL